METILILSAFILFIGGIFDFALIALMFAFVASKI